ncbi:MAG: cell division protein FtsA [Candidatus Omnitrophica bacterium CG11_big_fil_rev_8_21_14_0_20_42_13]|uniref:Cell division protein FtsA n=1 Tax=Candidatus Ghiorseimicrobium undicola TaxID=1974746 RepID=A0A2H0LVB5_9BACT|nr:MAG: cell division protein FtsA [Candidatus Omnitrophica bacterium CG11_big_fil_rev_8_21_14_0_20_42_13]
MLSNILKSNKIICGIDLGSSRIKAAVGITDKKLNLLQLAYDDIKSTGISKGFITDISLLTHNLKQLIKRLEHKTGQKIKNVSVGINGQDILFRNASAMMPLIDKGNKIVTLSDMNRISSYARSLNLKFEEEIIHDIIFKYTLDDHNRLENPRGLYGHKLAVDLYLVVSKITRIENTVKLITHAGLELEDIVFSGIASGSVCLSDEEKKKGAILIDIGADLTQFLIFKDGVLCFADIIDYGGGNISNAISEILKLPIELAEEIKDSYGSAALGDINENEEVIIKKGDSYFPIKRKVISSIIEPELTQLFMRIKDKINSTLSLQGMNYSLVITGGTSLLDGLIELAELIFATPVRLGIPKLIAAVSLPPVKVNDGQAVNRNGAITLPISCLRHATSIGFIQHAINSNSAHRLSLFNAGNSNPVAYLMSRMKDIYSEYF